MGGKGLLGCRDGVGQSACKTPHTQMHVRTHTYSRMHALPGLGTCLANAQDSSGPRPWKQACGLAEGCWGNKYVGKEARLRGLCMAISNTHQLGAMSQRKQLVLELP